MARVTLDDLTIRFGAVTAVDTISLDIEEGEFVVLLGPSGCGKTTTLRCIAGLETATEGRILFNGQAVEGLSPKERGVAMVFQFVSLYPHLTVAENIAFPLKARGERGAGVRKKVEAIAKTFDLSDALRRRPGALPPGAWQKAAIARAVVREPKVLLLDEPLSAIDERFREEMRWELRHIQKELGTTTVHVTHDQREAMSLADRVVLMRDGRIVQEGPPDALYNDPVDMFAAHFIGSPSMNFMPLTMRDGALTLGAAPLAAPDGLIDRLSRAAPDNAITLGVRPQDVAAGESEGGGVSVDGEVVAVSSTGRLQHVDVKVGDTVYKAMAPLGMPFGETTRLSLPTDRLLFFGENGNRVRV